MSFLKTYQENLVVDFGIAELKNLMDKKDNKFFVKWITETEFKISLNFSIGTNFLDVNNDSKSAIIADVTLSEVTDNKTHIFVKTKFKYGLIFILFIPIIMLILELTMDLGIPIAFYFVFPIFFIFTLYIFRSEEKRLIRYFKGLISTEK